MGNEYNICQARTTQETNLLAEKITIAAPCQTNLVHRVHKTLQQFIEDNAQFFGSDGHAIAHILVASEEQFEERINEFPIQRVHCNTKVFLPNLTQQQFEQYEGQCMLLDFQKVEFYLGDVVKGRKQGNGILINRKGNKYEGEFSNDVQNGKGFFDVLYPKRLYKGQWKNGKLEGYGEAQYEDGAQYVGIFYQGKKHGTGILTFVDGAVYQGSFTLDLMHGYGTLTSTKGRQISGEWKQGKYQIVKPQRTSRTFSINELPV